MDEQSYAVAGEAVSDKPEASADNAVSIKLFSDRPSLIPASNDIAKLAHEGDERRLVAPPFVTNQPKFRDDLPSSDRRRLTA
jgi:hypothetical protein